MLIDEERKITRKKGIDIMELDLHIKTSNKLLAMYLLGKLEDEVKTIKIIKESIRMTQNNIDEINHKIANTRDKDDIRRLKHSVVESKKRLYQLKKEYDLTLKNVPSIEIKLGSLID